ncbi:hypothetical protein ACWDOP_04415 [Nocardia sp. NPDC003693]
MIAGARALRLGMALGAVRVTGGGLWGDLGAGAAVRGRTLGLRVSVAGVVEFGAVPVLAAAWRAVAVRRGARIDGVLRAAVGARVPGDLAGWEAVRPGGR